MCMACNNRRCEVCHQRYGEHRVGDDACPDDKPGEFRVTSFAKAPPRKRARPDRRASKGSP